MTPPRRNATPPSPDQKVKVLHPRRARHIKGRRANRWALPRKNMAPIGVVVIDPLDIAFTMAPQPHERLVNLLC
jgi:hypothetical protein